MKTPSRCQHEWERRADLDAPRVLRFSCRGCKVLGYRALDPAAPVLPYPDRRTRMPGDFDLFANPEKRVYSDRHGLAQWLGREVYS
jgi:hypothetical protein